MSSKISALTAVTTPDFDDEIPVNQAGTNKKATLRKLVGEILYRSTPADTAINSTSDVVIASHTVVDVTAGDQLIVEAWFTILNNSGATRVVVLTLDVSGNTDIEISTAALAASATLMHSMHFSAVIDVRSSSLAYVISRLEMQLAAGIASGGDVTVAATMLENMSWETFASSIIGSVAVGLMARSANATATQTLRLHHLSVRHIRP